MELAYRLINQPLSYLEEGDEEKEAVGVSTKLLKEEAG